jgi:hypothetical protein
MSLQQIVVVAFAKEYEEEVEEEVGNVAQYVFCEAKKVKFC